MQLQNLNNAEGYLFDQNDNQINVKDLAKGNYILQIWSEGKQTTRKIILF